MKQPRFPLFFLTSSRICTRRELGRCQMQYRAGADNDAFHLNGATTNKNALNGAFKCDNDGIFIGPSKDVTAMTVRHQTHKKWTAILRAVSK